MVAHGVSFQYETQKVFDQIFIFELMCALEEAKHFSFLLRP